MENAILTANQPAEAATPAERDYAARYLAATRDRLAEALKGLSDAQWNFKSQPNRWSIAEIVEHLTIIEDRVKDIIAGLPQAAADSPERDVKQMDATIVAAIPIRYPRFEAPPRVSPVGGRSGSQAFEQLLASRARTIEAAATATHLRGRIFPHPIFGPWDGYQWLLGVSAHCCRHTGQILELREDPSFPKA